MSDKPMKIPDPDHPITIAPHAGLVVVTAGGFVIAATLGALTLREAGYPPVLYIPRADVEMTALARTDHTTFCPYKGDASYFSIPAGGERAVNAAWTYEAPFAAMAEIREYIAFYPDRVDSIGAPGHQQGIVTRPRTAQGPRPSRRVAPPS